MQFPRVLLCIFVLFVSLYFPGCFQDKEKIEYRSTAYPVNQNDRLVISDITWSWDKNDLTVQGKIKNTGTITVSGLKILIKAYAAGSMITDRDTYVSPSTLSANTQVDWKVTDYDCPKPDSVSVGYSYSADITVPALRIIF